MDAIDCGGQMSKSSAKVAISVETVQPPCAEGQLRMLVFVTWLAAEPGIFANWKIFHFCLSIIDKRSLENYWWSFS